MSWTNEQFAAYQARRAATRTQSEHGPRPASHADCTVEARHPRKCIVRITCFRARQLQDPDNGIYKFHIDAIRRAGLVDNDTAQAIRLEIRAEVKVDTLDEERTEIEVIRL